MSPLSPPRSPLPELRKNGGKNPGKKELGRGAGGFCPSRGIRCVLGVGGSGGALGFGGVLLGFSLPVLPPVPSSGFRRFFRKEKPPRGHGNAKEPWIGVGESREMLRWLPKSPPPRPPSPFPLYLSSAFPSFFIPERDMNPRPPPRPSIPWKCGDGGPGSGAGVPGVHIPTTAGKFLFC